MTESLASGDRHRTVLLQEAVDALAIQDARHDGIYIDATFGRGGHSRLILSQLSAQGRLRAFDKDPQASFAAMKNALNAEGIEQVDGVLMELGMSSPQVDDAERGFSFRADGPLDMRMDTTRGMPASAWLATATQDNLERVIRDYGEERFAFQIAKAIVDRRAVGPIATTGQLAALVAGAVKTREKGKDPATRTFQAVRIFINQELEDLETGLKQAFDLLAPFGRLVVISFHSLEDRIVKRFLAAQASAPQLDRRLPIRAADLPLPSAKLLPRVMPSEAEVAFNTRARSAVMRGLIRLPQGATA
ncbi:MAG: 16S rRNA (cytosine(1402)-N(4))-methyltransferase RsmH [Oxalobacteraceae bacterium]|nr:16S rRNA (cytosine(1402)-N(4))-methyltransferase RsmH [Oxalobacteraceae bacterium]